MKRLVSQLIVVFCLVLALAGITSGTLAAQTTRSVLPQTPQPPTMKDYWSGMAEWKLYQESTLSAYPTWTQGNTLGAHIEVFDGVWYLFSRNVYWTLPACPSSRYGGPRHGTVIRQSLDGGKTWIGYMEVVIPNFDNVGNQACMATDGDVYFRNGTWYYLYQCMGTDGIWDVCHAEFTSPLPTGRYTIDPSHSTTNGQLWSQICNVGDHCPPTTEGEGTLDIIKYENGYYWVGFHGYNPGTQRGYRGIAKTTDFHTWEVNDSNGGVPTDTIFYYTDTLKWRESWNGPIGGGHANILYDKTDRYYYMVIEAADVSLGGAPGQKWDIGLLRSKTLSNINWEQYPAGNPIAYSSTALDFKDEDGITKIAPVNLQYARLFTDTTNNTYLMYARDSYNPAITRTIDRNNTGLFVYKLTWSGNNILRNGDLSMGNIPGTLTSPYWYTITNGTKFSVYRYPNKSSDRNQYAEISCGNVPCVNHSFYQDIDVSAYRGSSFTFGGKFATVAGTGQLKIRVFQLGDNRLPLCPTCFRDVVGQFSTSYTSVDLGTTITISPSTKFLRYQVYPLIKGITFKADEMYVRLSGNQMTDWTGPTQWNQSNLGHLVGRSEGSGQWSPWSANTTQDSSGYLQYGPYTILVSPGEHTAIWKLMIDNNSNDDLAIVRLDVFDADSNVTLASREVKRREWLAPYVYEYFSLPFTLDSSRIWHRLEFRVYWYDRAYIKEERVGVR